MGNPHAVIFFKDLNELNKIDIEKIGIKIQKSDIFPESVNVEFATILEDKTIRMKVWERGAGRTLACGSGACATLVAANQQNLSLRKNDIILDGGKLTIDWLESEDVIMSGEVKLVFKVDPSNLAFRFVKFISRNCSFAHPGCETNCRSHHSHSSTTAKIYKRNFIIYCILDGINYCL